MAYTLDELTAPLTREQVRAKIYAGIAAQGVDTTIWKPGAVLRTMIAAGSIVMSAYSELAAMLARAGFLELATGAWLTLVARYVYGVDRQAATFAEGSVTLVNNGGGIFALDPDDLVLSNPDTGKQYRNTGAINLGANTTITIPVRAVEAGAASTAGAGAIREFVTPLIGVTASNAQAVAGLDEETDSELRARSYEKLGALSPMGPWDAYSFAVRNAKRADGTLIGIKRVRTTNDGAGNVTTYVATSSGGVTGVASDASTDLGAADEAVQQWAAPLAVTAYTASATPLAIAVTYKLWLYNTSGRSPAEIQAAVLARLVAFMAAQPIGGNIVGGNPGKVFHDAIRTAIGATLPQIFHVEVTSPASDVTLTASQVPTLGTVTAAAITQVAPAGGAAP